MRVALFDLKTDASMRDRPRPDEPLWSGTTLLVPERPNGIAGVRLTLDWLPMAIPAEKFKYEIVLTNNQPTTQWAVASSNMANNPVWIDWTNRVDLNGQTNRLFIARGWYDCDQDGIFDEEEPLRQAYIAVVGADYEVKNICTTGVHNAHSVAVKIGPAIAGLTVRMELQKTTGQGSAIFTNNNAAVIDITVDTNLVLRGIQYSTVLSNMQLRASYGGYDIRARKFTIRDIDRLRCQESGTSHFVVDDNQAYVPTNTLWICQQSNDTAKVEVTTTVWPGGNFTDKHWWEFVIPSTSAPGVEWTPQRTNTLAGPQTATWTLPTGAQTNRLFHLRSWYDCDDNDVADTTNEPIRAVRVGVVNTERLTLTHTATGLSTSDTTWVTAPAFSNDTLFVCQTNNGPIAFTLNLDYAPSIAPADRMRFLVKRTGAGVVAGHWNTTSGNFVTNPVNLTWTQPASGPVYRSFDIQAWYDCNGNGVLNGHEPRRCVHVCIPTVEIEKCASGFLSQGGTNDNTTTIRAFVTPSTAKGKFKFTLFDVSDEPGYCMNAPTNVPATGEDSDAWKDFQFPAQTGFSISGSDSNIAETVTNDLHEATVTIKSFDYGSFGKIKAEFTTQDGSLTCVAKELGGTNEYTRLPADANVNNIADSWSGDTGPGANSLATNDADNVPTGKIGDGFTRYEEWRGFIVGGIHVRTDPTKRDLFVYDQDGIGIGYYASGSGIQAHLINAGEWSGTGKKADDKRIVNINRETAASSKQYGLHVYDGGTPGGTEGGYCYGDPTDLVPLGPPNACWKIKINTGNIQNWFGTNGPQVIARTIAHEMGHATGVEHHTPTTGGQLCVMREPCSDTNIGTTFCTTNDNCKSKIDVKDP